MQLKRTHLTLAILLLLGICLGVLPMSLAEEAESGKQDERITRLVKAVEALELSRKERTQALMRIDTYADDRGKLASAGWERWIEEIDLIGKLQLDMETVLPEEQFVKWVNGVFKTDQDNWEYVKDERIQHRTYPFAEAGGVEIPYALFVPSHYDEKKSYPVMVGLHGMECAHDTVMAFDPLLDLAEEQGYIVVTPLGYRWNSWYGSVDPGRSGRLAEMDVMNVLDIVRSEFNIDEDRIYLFGHFMGGAGTYHLAGQYPDVWAGLAVVNPGPFATPDTMELCKHLPILVLQGDQDDLVTTTRIWVAKMQELGMQHVYVEVPGVDHGAFGMARIVSFFNTVQKFSKIRALIIDGQNNHAVWPKSTIMMRQYLEETGLFTVDIDRTQFTWKSDREKAYLPLAGVGDTEDLKNPKADPNFSPDFAAYDVVISNFGWNAADWPEATQKALEDYIANGGGFVVVHAADNCFPEWLEYNKMIGLGGWGDRDEKDGPYVYFTDEGKEIRDDSPGSAGSHGPQHEFAVTIRDATHPITQGMPEVWRHAKDECYAKLRGPAENMTILATGRDVSGKAPTDRHEPILMVLDYGKGRVFHTTLGHDDYSCDGVGFIETFTRGAEWAATGKVSQKLPEDFPTADKGSSRSFELKE